MRETNSSSLLDSFKTVTLITGIPTLSITRNGFGFNKTCIVKMEQCSHVNLMIDEDSSRIAIKQCHEHEAAAIPFYKGQANMNVRWNNSDLMKRIERLTGWDLNQCGYRLDGDYFEDISAMIFDLNNAEIITN